MTQGLNNPAPYGQGDPYSQWDGAYVLGALVPAERREYEVHLSGCGSCRAQVAALAGMGGLLSLLPAQAAEPVAGPVPAYAALAARVRRRRSLWVGAAAAAGILLAAGTATVTASVTSAVVAQSTHTVAAGVVHLSFAPSPGFPGPGQQGLVATGSLTPHSWGTGIDWECSYTGAGGYSLPGGSSDYVLVVVARDGTESTVASWSAAAGATVAPTATTNLPVSAIAHIDIRRSAAAATLLRASP